jgi:DNA topoisomerase-3
MEQMIKSFGEPTKKEITDIELLIEQTPFYAKGTKIIVSGWESYFKAVKDESEEQEDEQNLPHLQQGDTCRLTELKVCERKTNAPPLHTEASLLKSMETAGKEIADEELRQAMKDTGIGTPATRASIIETLLLRSYIERKGKTIIPTMLGLEVYNLVKEKDFASPELTGNWESRLAKMEKGSLTREQFMDDIVAYTKNITDDLQKLGKQVVPNNFQAESEHKCPKCSKQIRETKYNWQCDCGFKLSKIILEKQLKEKHLKEILKHKKTFIKGFKSQKTGKLFDATLALKDDYTTEFVFKK